MKHPPVASSAGALAIRSGTVDEFVTALAVRLEELERMDLRSLVELGQAADRAAEQTTLKRYRRLKADAERAQRALEGLAMKAQLRAGEVLLSLDGGGPGRGKKSERTRAREAAGLDGREARRLVELAELDEDVREQACEQLAEAGKRVTVRSVLAIAQRRTSVGSDEWYTPKAYAEAARRVFGGYPDCDAASCSVAQATIRAKRFWSAAALEFGEAERAAGIKRREFLRMKREEWAGAGVLYQFPTGEVIEPDDKIEDEAKRAKAFAKRANAEGRLGHAHQLRGTVWLNPPYSFPAPFVRAVIEGYVGTTLEDAWSRYAEALGTTETALDADEDTAATWRSTALERAAASKSGPITEAIVLVNVATSTAAGQNLLATSSAACFVARRISFLDAHGEAQDGNRYEQVVFYLGERPEVFAREFSRFGAVVIRAPEAWRSAA